MSEAVTLGEISLPRTLGPYSAAPDTIHDFEKDQPGLGYSMSYLGDGAYRDAVTAYTYTYGIKDLPNSIDSDVFRGHLSEAVQGVAKSAVWLELRIFDQGVFTVPGRTPRIQYVVLEGLPHNARRPVHNVVWLTVVNHTFVKFRGTTEATRVKPSIVNKIARGLVFHFDPPAAGAGRFDTAVWQDVRRRLSPTSGVSAVHLGSNTILRNDIGMEDSDISSLLAASATGSDAKFASDLIASIVTLGQLVAVIERVKSGQAPIVPEATAAAPEAPAKSGLLSRMFGGG